MQTPAFKVLWARSLERSVSQVPCEAGPGTVDFVRGNYIVAMGGMG